MLVTKEDVKELSTEEIQEILSILNNELESREMARLLKIRADLVEIASRYNMTPEALISQIGSSGRAKKRLGRLNNIKYQNPYDPSQTWTGRGKRPNWLVERLEAGESLESFLIPEQDQDN